MGSERTGFWFGILNEPVLLVNLAFDGILARYCRRATYIREVVQQPGPSKTGWMKSMYYSLHTLR